MRITGLFVLFQLVYFALCCANVTLPSSTASGTGNATSPCPGSPVLVQIPPGPFKYTIPADYQFDYAYVSANNLCTMVYIGQPFIHCLSVLQVNDTVSIYYSGSKSCKKIDSVSFYAINCANECTAGQFRCNGNDFEVCDDGKWALRTCRPGTVCKPFADTIICTDE